MFDQGDRVITPEGRGTVVYRRMAPPTYAEPAAYSVRLDSRAGDPTYNGTIYAARDVAAASELSREHRRVLRAVDSGNVNPARDWIALTELAKAGLVTMGKAPNGQAVAQGLTASGRAELARRSR